MPLALLLDTDDSLRRAGRIVMQLADPAGPGEAAESRIAQTAIDAVLRDTGRSPSGHAVRYTRDRDATLLRAARALDDLDVRLADVAHS